MALPSLVVFGPQTIWPSAEYLSQIRYLLLNEPCLSIFLSAIRDLPNLWTALVETNPRLSCVPGVQVLNDLKRWVDTGDMFSYASDIPPNVLSTPLTVIIHIVQYLDYTRHNVSHVCILESVKDGGIQ